MTKTTARQSRYTDAEREQFKAERAALVEAVKSGEIEFDDEAAERAFERLTDRFSYRNSMLIMLQCPSTRGDVKAMSKWNEEGRKIRKGSKAIYILAPAGDRKNADVEIDETEGDGLSLGTALRTTRKRFVWVRVFDRSQTEKLPADWTPRKPKSDPRTAAIDSFLS